MKHKKKKRTRQTVSDDSVTPKGEIPIIDALIAVDDRRIEERSEIYQTVKLSLTANDADVRIHEAGATGEEAVGGHAPTPDQDVVEELGEAAGIAFQDNQPLQTHEEIWAERDRRRWELDRRSADDALCSLRAARIS